MKIAIVSDIHGNLWALQAVMEHMNTQNIDKKVCLGDIVGYGPYPNECVEEVTSNFNFIVMGNHDNATFDKRELDTFTKQAKEGIEWTKGQLKGTNLDVLRHLEYGFVTDELMFVHGAPHAPFDYLDNLASVYNAFGNPINDFRVAFVGHTHVPAIWEEETGYDATSVRVRYNNSDPKQVAKYEYFIGENRAIFNVGSVGQPRDGDVRASYAIYDTEHNSIEFFRIPYSVDRTIAKMQKLSFPTLYWSRLMYGK